MHTHGGDIQAFIRQYNVMPDAVLDLSVNTWPFGIPDDLLVLLTHCLHTICTYPDIHAESLQSAIAQHHNFSERHVIASNGSIQIIYALCSSPQYTHVLTVEPTFNEYRQAATVYNKLHQGILCKEMNFSGTLLHDIEKKIHDNQLIFICNPNNPTGILCNHFFIKNLLDMIQGRNSLLVVDEAFIDFAPQYSVAQWINEEQQLVVMRSLTKYFGLAGLRAGYAIAHPERISEIARFIPPWAVNTLAQTAGSWVLQHKGDFDFCRSTWLQETRCVMSALTRYPSIQVYPSATTYFTAKFLSEKIADEFDLFMGRAGILVRRCGDYTGLDQTFFRIGTRTAKENQRFLKASESFFGSRHD